MKWGTTILTVALLIALVWASGCANVSFGNVKASNFGSTPDQQKLIDCFIAKYGDPRTDTGGARFLEPIVTTNVVNDMPVDNVQSFSKDTAKIFFWVFYDNFAKGDMLDMKLVYLTNGQTVVTTQQQAGGEYGAATGSVEKPDTNWPVGKYSITFSGKGTSGTVTFEITDAATKTIPPVCDLAASSGNAVPAPGSRGNPVGQADAGSLTKEALAGKVGTGSGSKEDQVGNRPLQPASDLASKEAQVGGRVGQVASDLASKEAQVGNQVVQPASGPALSTNDQVSNVNLNTFYGIWKKKDSNTAMISTLSIFDEKGKVTVHANGKCGGTVCDWGKSTGTIDQQNILHVFFSGKSCDTCWDRVTIEKISLHEIRVTDESVVDQVQTDYVNTFTNEDNIKF